MRYLLSMQALFDIAKHQGLPAETWFENQPMDDVYLGAVTWPRLESALEMKIAHVARGEAEDGVTADQIRAVRDNAYLVVSHLKQHERILSADEDVLKIWIDLLNDPRLTRAGGLLESAERLEIATAMAGVRGTLLDYVAQAEPFHKHLNRLQVFDPAAIETGRP